MELELLDEVCGVHDHRRLMAWRRSKIGVPSDIFTGFGAAVLRDLAPTVAGTFGTLGSMDCSGTIGRFTPTGASVASSDVAGTACLLVLRV